MVSSDNEEFQSLINKLTNGPIHYCNEENGVIVIYICRYLPEDNNNKACSLGKMELIFDPYALPRSDESNQILSFGPS